MQANLKQIRKQRRYSEEFKRSLVTSFEKGEFSVTQLEKLYGIRNSVIYRWVYQYSSFNEKGCRIVEMDQSSEKKLKELAAKVKELEQLVGQKQIAIEYLEKMIELAKTDLNIDIKKITVRHHQLVQDAQAKSSFFYDAVVWICWYKQAGCEPIW